MNGFLNEVQKKQLFLAVVTFLLALAAVFGYDFGVVQPRELDLVGLEPASSDSGLVQSVYNVSSNPLRVKKAGVNVVEGWNGNNIKLYSDAGTTTAVGLYGANGALRINAPTTVATSTPVAVINSAGLGNLLEVQKATTPVFKINGAGVITGNVLQYGSSGQKIVCGQTAITGTGAIAHGLATPSYVMKGLAGDVTGDANIVSHTNVSATVTIKIWNSALTPVAATTPVAVDWCVIGTP